MPQPPCFADTLRSFSLPAWESLPDLGLYMDQVITFLERQYSGVYGMARRIVTPSIINHYVKNGLVTRPVAKKYEREQIAQLLMLCAMKQAATMEDMKQMFAASGESVKAQYCAFRAMHEMILPTIADAYAEASPMQCAVTAAAYQLLCHNMLYGEETNHDQA